MKKSTYKTELFAHQKLTQNCKSTMKKKCFVIQSCLTLCNPMDCHQSGSSVQGFLQARILQRVAIPFFRGSSHPVINLVLPHCRQFLYPLSHST